ncbi:unnamed protein product [Thlaspi arvense]|uniref:Uncharacterized protein n=1 Tax=Thlaspi arvense TaxID=13288 RepID=A0AAU9T935_THLAR|nr:unnamed protein product [Thlaspi arvense]
MIRLYLERAVATNRRTCGDYDDLSNLEIRKVAIESTQDPNEGFKAKNASFYISYMDPSKDRVGKHVDRMLRSEEALMRRRDASISLVSIGGLKLNKKRLERVRIV